GRVAGRQLHPALQPVRVQRQHAKASGGGVAAGTLDHSSGFVPRAPLCHERAARFELAPEIHPDTAVRKPREQRLRPLEVAAAGGGARSATSYSATSSTARRYRPTSTADQAAV